MLSHALAPLKNPFFPQNMICPLFCQLITFTTKLLERDTCLQFFPFHWPNPLLSGFVPTILVKYFLWSLNHLHVAKFSGHLVIFDLSAAFETVDHSLWSTFLHLTSRIPLSLLPPWTLFYRLFRCFLLNQQTSKLWGTPKVQSLDLCFVYVSQVIFILL